MWQCASRNRRGDGEKTLGEAEKTFIWWRKRFIMIPGMSLSLLPHHRFVQDFTSYIIYYVLHLNNVYLEKLLFSRQGHLQPKSSSFPAHHSALGGDDAGSPPTPAAAA